MRKSIILHPPIISSIVERLQEEVDNNWVYGKSVFNPVPSNNKIPG